jgi:hypothetical protein
MQGLLVVKIIKKQYWVYIGFTSRSAALSDDLTTRFLKYQQSRGGKFSTWCLLLEEKIYGFSLYH